MKSKQFLFTLSVTLLCIVILLAQTSFAQFTLTPPNINATPLPVGSGARAIGQGSAFIAVADDATAASWNPGALIQLERPECSVVYSFLSTQQDFDTGSTGLPWQRSRITERFELRQYGLSIQNFGKNMVAALNYQQIYDFHLDLDFSQTSEDTTPPASNINQKIEFESKGGIGALTPALSVLVTPKVSLGVAVNYYTDEFFGDYAWKQTTTGKGIGNLAGTDITTAYDSDTTFKNFQAINLTFGMLWNVWEREEKLLTFGAVYDTPYTADMDRITDFTSVISPLGQSIGHKRDHFEVDYPMSFGAGLGFRYNDAISFSMDVTWADWSAYMQEDENGNKSRPLGGAPSDTDIDDTYAVRFGTEYLIFRQKVIVPVRGGLFYDPRPSLDDPTDVYGFSVGSGITFKRFSFDGAYQFRWANDIDGEDFGLSGTSFDLNDHMFLASIIVYF